MSAPRRADYLREACLGSLTLSTMDLNSEQREEGRGGG